MMINQPFKKTSLEESRDQIVVSLNPKERGWLEACKPLLQQQKDSTALKTLAEIGATFVMHDRPFRVFLNRFFKNVINNRRLGIPDQLPDPNKSEGQK